MTKEETRILVSCEYESIRNVFIDPSITKAVIELEFLPDAKITTPNKVCAYFPEEHKIRMVFSESEIENDYAMKGSELMRQEPVWKNYLRHEVIHEYQYKCVKFPSEEGKRLMRESKRRFEGKGHDETFYTAICECASKLGLDAKNLLESI